MAAPEPGWFTEAAGWIAGLALGLVGVVWKVNEKKHEDRRQGEIRLHERIGQHEKNDNDRFERIMQQMSDNHAELLNHVIQLKGDKK